MLCQEFSLQRNTTSFSYADTVAYIQNTWSWRLVVGGNKNIMVMQSSAKRSQHWLNQIKGIINLEWDSHSFLCWTACWMGTLVEFKWLTTFYTYCMDKICCQESDPETWWQVTTFQRALNQVCHVGSVCDQESIFVLHPLVTEKNKISKTEKTVGQKKESCILLPII